MKPFGIGWDGETYFINHTAHELNTTRPTGRNWWIKRIGWTNESKNGQWDIRMTSSLVYNLVGEMI